MATKRAMLTCHPEGERPFRTTLAKFLRDNDDDTWVKAEARKLRPGESVQLGGGAQPGFVVTRMGQIAKHRRRKLRHR